MDINCAREAMRQEQERKRNYCREERHNTITIYNDNTDLIKRVSRLEDHVDELFKMCYPKTEATINPIVSIVKEAKEVNVNSQMNITLTDEQFKEFCRIMQSK